MSDEDFANADEWLKATQSPYYCNVTMKQKQFASDLLALVEACRKLRQWYNPSQVVMGEVCAALAKVEGSV